MWLPFQPSSWIFRSYDNNEELPCLFEPALSSGFFILKYIHVINDLYEKFYVKFSLGHFDSSGHQSNSKILKTPQVPPGELI